MIYKKYSADELSSLGLAGNLPAHVGIIMDGNGRWAKAKHLPRSCGHRAGMETLHSIVKASHCIGIKALTVYAFSTENWQRPIAEVNALFSLLVEYFYKEIDELDENNVCIHALGDLDRFPYKVRDVISTAIERTSDNSGMKFCIAVNYGSRAEIVRAFRQLADEGVDAESVTEDMISDKLYTSGLPELDLIIRTAGEQRLSNFLLWQAAYSEFVFSPTLWPDFTPEQYFECLGEYMHRLRRFGKIADELAPPKKK